MKLRVRFSFAFLFICAPVWASSPLSGHFRPATGPYLVGGPAFIVFELVNNSNQTVRFQDANPLSPCAGYLFQIYGESRADGSCDGLRGYSCGSGTAELPPGGKATQRILLNYYYDLFHPGPYRVHAQRTLSWWPAHEGWFGENRQQQIFESDFELDLEPANLGQLRAAFAPYVKALDSEDSVEHQEAVSVIILVAPPFLEEKLLKMLDSEDWGQAIVGLQHLNTAHARQAIWKIAQAEVKPKPNADDLERAEREDEQAMGVESLGRMGDPAYLSRLLEITQAAAPDSQLHREGGMAIARLGGDDALPFLVAETESPSYSQRFQAVIDLQFTASRDAVPVLINLLQSPDEDIRQVADNSLEALTHRSAGTGLVSAVSSAWLHETWKNWWKLNSASAQIYGEHECGDKMLIN